MDANPIYYPLGRVSTFLDTLDIHGTIRGCHLYKPPLTSYPRIPWYSGHPRIIRGCQPIQYPLDRVSTDSLDTLDIPRLSVDANLYNTPMTEYPWIPWILWTSPDYPWMPTYTIPHWQSIHGFPGYSGHPRTIRGCQPI